MTDDAGQPVRDICVEADATNGSGDYYDTYSNADGSYLIEAPPGEYTVSFTDCVGEFADQWWEDASVAEDADPITVLEDEIVAGIDAELVRAETFGTIGGTITNEAGDPLPFICVMAQDADTGYPAFGQTDADGTYLLRGVGDPDDTTAELDYMIMFVDCSGFYGSEYYDNAIDPDDLTLVPASALDHVTGIDAVLQHDAPVNTGQPQLSGGTTIGSTLSTTNGTWGHAPSVFEYQWLQCDASGASCTTIPGATDPTYVTVSGDQGHKIRVTVTATNSIGSASRNSIPSGLVGAPGPLTAPVVSGALAVGSLLSVTAGTWSGSPTGYTYQWVRCDTSAANCAPIGSATSSTYTSAPADAGQRLRVLVTATNAAGSNVTQSTATAVIGAPSSLTSPVLSGQASVGSLLSVTDGTWSGNPTAYSYQWLRCDSSAGNCTVIPSAAASTYTLVAADAGHRIRVYVTATNANGSNRALSSAGAVVGAPVNTAAPVLSGTPDIGQTLSVTDGTWSGSPTGFTYQWYRCDANAANCQLIPSAAGSTYVLTGDDTGYRIRGYVTASNANGNGNALSNATTAVGAPISTVAPTVSGQAASGGTVSVTNGTWTGSPTGYGYQWYRCDASAASCTPISSATSSSYAVTSGDVGFRLRAYVTATNPAGSTRALSNATGVVGAPLLSANPVVTGDPAVGATLSVSDGTYAATPDTLTYQWLRCNTAADNCSPIADADDPTYVVTGDDTGHRIRAFVTATNGIGQTRTLTNATRIIGAPTSVTAPVLSGTATSGSTLSVTQGAWNGSPSTYEYTWLRCNNVADNCSVIAGAENATYELVGADVGHRVRVFVTARNAAGGTREISNATPMIS